MILPFSHFEIFWIHIKLSKKNHLGFHIGPSYDHDGGYTASAAIPRSWIPPSISSAASVRTTKPATFPWCHGSGEFAWAHTFRPKLGLSAMELAGNYDYQVFTGNMSRARREQNVLGALGRLEDGFRNWKVGNLPSLDRRTVEEMLLLLAVTPRGCLATPEYMSEMWEHKVS